jgi:hypothetical protein
MTDDSYIKIRPHSVNGLIVDQAMLMPSAEAISAQILDATCPVTTQRMIKIVAAKSVVDHQAGRRAVPFWRVVDPDKPNSQKLPGGREFILARRKDEKA